MKTLFLLCMAVELATLGCTPKPDVAPGETWSQGCITLKPDGQTYRLEGMCCEYVVFPLVRLGKGQAFSANGTYYTFTGAGFAGSPAVVHGEVSPTGTSLNLAYSANSTVSTYTLQPGPATASCLCGCD